MQPFDSVHPHHFACCHAGNRRQRRDFLLFRVGDLIFSLTFNRNQELWPLTAGIYNVISQYGIEWNDLMAFAVISVLPVILIFVLLQKQLVKGLVSGSIK